MFGSGLGGIMFLLNSLLFKLNSNSRLIEFKNFRILCLKGIIFPSSLKIYEFIFDNIVVKKNSRLLDVGCGTGILSILFSKYSRSITCSDIDPLSVECTRINGFLNNLELNVVESDLLNSVNGSFDCIIFSAPNFIGEGSFSLPLKKMKLFCRQAYSHLIRKGELYLVINSKYEHLWIKNLKGFSTSVRARRRFLFSKVSILKAVKL